MAETYVIEIRAGRGEPSLLELRPGVEVAPLSVGTGGHWKISASGMKVVHAYLYFDGESLFLHSADALTPMTVDGEPVPVEWTPVDPPCTITLAQAELAFRTVSAVDVADEEPTFAEPIPDPLIRNPETPAAPVRRPRSDRPARPFKRGAFAHSADDESTRLQPVSADDGFRPPDSGDATRVDAIQPKPSPHMSPAAAARDMNVRPAAGVPWDRSATNPLRSAPTPSPADEDGDPTEFGAPQLPPDAFAPRAFQRSQPAFDQTGPAGGIEPPGLLNVPPPSVPRPAAAESVTSKIKREWAAAPPLRKGLIAVFPFAFAGFLWVMFGADPAQPGGVAATPSSSVSASAAAAAPSRGQRQASAVQDPAALPVIPPYTPADSAVRAAAVPAPSPLPAGPDAGQATSDRRERQAADYVATHAYEQAIRLYDQLATERPQNPAFHEASRILRQKLDSGTP